MARRLLDVNELIALLDPAHVPHAEVHERFGRIGRKAFAACPLTENGLLRIVGHSQHANSPRPPSVAASALLAIRAPPGHEFCSDCIRLADSKLIDVSLLSSHCRVTDSELLGLAHANKARLAALDHKLATEVVAEGKAALILI